MPSLFLDTSYLVAILDPEDKWHQKAVSINNKISSRRDFSIFVSTPVLTEFLGFFSKYSPPLRRAAAKGVKGMISDASVSVIYTQKSEFLEALELYASRQDKKYSLVDCHIMCMTKRMKLTGVLSFDGDFDDEGIFQIDSERKMAAFD